MLGPLSSYSCLEIHICWKVDKDAKMEPPIQTEYLRSGGAMILTFIDDGARAVISFCIRSAIPGYYRGVSDNFAQLIRVRGKHTMVVPPDMTMFP